jgi:hypothetical protein
VHHAQVPIVKIVKIVATAEIVVSAATSTHLARVQSMPQQQKTPML